MRLVLLLAFTLAPERTLPPVDLDVVDAPAREVIGGLAALHGLTLVVERSAETMMSRRMTLRLEHVDFSRALGAIGAAAGVELKTVGTRLIASGVKESPPPAPDIPPPLRDAPRVAMEEHARRNISSRRFEYERLPVAGGEFTVRVRKQRGAACYRLRTESSGLVAAELPEIRIVQLGYDQARKTRFLVLDPAQGPVRVARVREGESETNFDLTEDTTVMISGDADPRCSVVAAGTLGSTATDRPVLARVLLLPVEGEGSAQLGYGWCVVSAPGEGSTHGAVANSLRREPREWNLTTYVPRRGSGLALLVEVGLASTDPRDQREYYYAQYGASDELVDLRREGVRAGEIPVGPATPAALELRVYAEEDRWLCSSRAAQRSP
jgi:hypothetical protein